MAFCDSVSVGNTDFYKYLLWLAGWWRVHEKLPEQFLPPALGWLVQCAWWCTLVQISLPAFWLWIKPAHLKFWPLRISLQIAFAYTAHLPRILKANTPPQKWGPTTILRRKLPIVVEKPHWIGFWKATLDWIQSSSLWHSRISKVARGIENREEMIVKYLLNTR